MALDHFFARAVSVASVAFAARLVWGMPGLTVTLLATLGVGIFLGLAAAATLAALAIYCLTRPATPSSAAQLHSDTTWAAPGASTARDVTTPGPTMPHAIARGGEFSGIIYTVCLSQWQRDACVLDWPPADPPFVAWKAHVSEGTLVLDPLPHRRAPPSSGGSAKQAQVSGEGSAPASARAGDSCSAAPPVQHQVHKVGIPLEGCHVEVVRDGLQGRSEMVRRAPLLVTHPRYPLLQGEPGFYVFAIDPASKQQWLHALSFWCVDGQWLRGMDSAYAAYCAVMRELTLLPYSHEAPPPVASGALPAAALAPHGLTQPRGNPGGPAAQPAARNPAVRRGPAVSVAPLGSVSGDGSGAAVAGSTAVATTRGGGRKAWKQWGSAKVQELRQRVQEQRGRGAAASAAPAQGAGAVAAAPDLGSIMEQRWMQSRKIQVPPVARSAGGSSAPPSPGAHRPEGLHSDSLVTPRGDLPPGSSPKGSSSPSAAAMRQTAFSQQAGSAAPRPGAAAPGPAAAADRATFGRDSPRGQPPRVTVTPNATELPPSLPRRVIPDQFVNMMITRAAFDLLRNPAFQELVRARIQRQLSRLHTPDYVQSLEVVGVTPGCTAPTVANFAALPAPTAAVWPQLTFDMRYTGSFTVTIECKVDIRDAPAWSTLDKALSKIEGRRRKPDGERGGLSALVDEVEGAVLVPDPTGGPCYDEEEEEEGQEETALLQDSRDCRPGGGLRGAGTEAAVGGDVEGGAGGDERRQGRPLLGNLRQTTANRLRKLAENTASHISKLPLRVSLTFSLLEGTMCLWVPPPPGDRLFWSFLTPPRLELRAKPELGGRVLKYAYHASRASAWIQSRMELSFSKNLVFPGGGDIPLPLLLGMDNPRAADELAGLAAHARRGGDTRSKIHQRSAAPPTAARPAAGERAEQPPVQLPERQQAQVQQQQQLVPAPDVASEAKQPQLPPERRQQQPVPPLAVPQLPQQALEQALGSLSQRDPQGPPSTVEVALAQGVASLQGNEADVEAKQVDSSASSSGRSSAPASPVAQGVAAAAAVGATHAEQAGDAVGVSAAVQNGGGTLGSAAAMLPAVTAEAVSAPAPLATAEAVSAAMPPAVTAEAVSAPAPLATGEAAPEAPVLAMPAPAAAGPVATAPPAVQEAATKPFVELQLRKKAQASGGTPECEATPGFFSA